MKKAKTKKAGITGRKLAFLAAYLSDTEGTTHGQFADKFGVSRNTIQTWLKDNAELIEAARNETVKSASNTLQNLAVNAAVALGRVLNEKDDPHAVIQSADKILSYVLAKKGQDETADRVIPVIELRLDDGKKRGD